MSAPTESQMMLDDIMDSDLAVDALYKSGDEPATKIRLIRRDLEVGGGGLGGIGVSSPGMQVEILKSHVAKPLEGDKITLSPADGVDTTSPEFWKQSFITIVRKVRPTALGYAHLITLNKELC